MICQSRLTARDLPFNRTSMESKLARNSGRQVRQNLLIEPVWNRNGIGKSAPSNNHLRPFNRTSMESKPALV